MRAFSAYIDTLVAIGRDFGLMLILVGAPIFYSFLYPLPYKNEIATSIPVAVVDQDASALSRTIVRNVAASPRLRLIATYPEIAAARQALVDGEDPRGADSCLTASSAMSSGGIRRTRSRSGTARISS